jgi:hypothetical protein
MESTTADIDSNGVDREQIRRQLALTPAERLRALESFLASVLKVRRGIRRAEDFTRSSTVSLTRKSRSSWSAWPRPSTFPRVRRWTTSRSRG